MGAMRWILIPIVFIALLVLSVQNTQSARLSFFNVAAWEAPLALIVFVAFSCGAAAGLLAGALRTARLKRQLTRFRREQRGGGEASATTPMPVPGTTPASGPGFER